MLNVLSHVGFDHKRTDLDCTLGKIYGDIPCLFVYTVVEIVISLQRQVGFDRQHRPVIYCGFVQCTSQHHSTEESIQHTTYLMENAARSLQTDGAYSYVWVMDFTG